MKPVEKQIIDKLTAVFDPTHLQVVNESHMHRGPEDAETHFNVIIAANVFAGKRQVQRHQTVYACLAEELKNGVHALALHTFSPDEWLLNSKVAASPVCMGGSKHDGSAHDEDK